MASKIYKNSTEVAQVHGVPMYMEDMLDACLVGRLNLFLQGDTGSGKTQLAADAMQHFGDKSLFILGRNDMDTRELFQQTNLEKLRTAKSSAEIKEVTNKVDTHLIVVDEMPNCVPAVRAQLFNLFDGYIEINGQKYPIGNGYSVGIATGNVGQKFTESANELGRALKDRMHVILDTDYFAPQPCDTLEILAGSTNPRVEFGEASSDGIAGIIDRHKQLTAKDVPLEKLIIANYLVHGLDYCRKGSKRKMKDAWPTQLENHEQGSDVGLVLPVSTRAAKSIVRLSQALDEIARGKGASQETIDADAFGSMMNAYKFASAYSGVLNEASVDKTFAGNRYAALDAVISATQTEFEGKADAVRAGLEMVRSGKSSSKVLNLFNGRWEFMRSTLGGLKNYGNTNS